MSVEVKKRAIVKEFKGYLFRPEGALMNQIEISSLAHEEMEALRLIDIEGLSQVDAAAHMEVSRATIQRVLNAARAKVASALIDGRGLEILGGDYKVIGKCKTQQCICCNK